MKYGIMMNPVSGVYSLDKKRKFSKSFCKIFEDCVADGFDTKSKEEFCDCARDLSQKVDTLVVCGGDGTFLDVINSVDMDQTLAYIPFGTGNALKYALDYPKNLKRIAKKIKNGKEKSLDLLLCEGKKAFMSSVGIEAYIMKKSEEYRCEKAGFKRYAKATMKSLMEGYARTNAEVDIDGEKLDVKKAISLTVTKIPYYGYGLEMVPNAKFDDGNLHFLSFNSMSYDIPYMLLSTAIMGRNEAGNYKKAKKIKITTEDDIDLQINGDYEKKAKEFNFEVLPNRLKIRY